MRYMSGRARFWLLVAVAFAARVAWASVPHLLLAVLAVVPFALYALNRSRHFWTVMAFVVAAGAVGATVHAAVPSCRGSASPVPVARRSGA